MPPNAPHRRDFVENRIYYSVSGGDNEIRTRDLCVANASLYQLSHIPTDRPKTELNVNPVPDSLPIITFFYEKANIFNSKNKTFCICPENHAGFRFRIVGTSSVDVRSRTKNKTVF